MQKESEVLWKKRIERLKAENLSLREKLATLKKDNHNIQKSFKNKNKLFNSLPTGVLLIQQGKIIDINKMALDQLGYPVEEILGSDFLNFVHPDFKAFMRNLHKKRVSGKWAPDEYEIDLVTKNGETLCFDVSIKKIRFNGRTAFLENLIRNEKRKKREKEIIQSKKEESLITMASGLIQKFSPDLKAITESINQLRDLTSSEGFDLAEGLEHIEHAADQIINTARKLENLTATENDRTEMTLFDLKMIVKDAVALTKKKLKDVAEIRGVKINIKTYLRSVSPVEGDPNEIQDVIIDMILNAVDVMPEGGDLYLSTEENSGYAHIFIQDSGSGIPEHIKERIFDPFFTTKGNDRACLGLSLSNAIIKRYKGEIEVTSEKGQGTVFTIRLPLAIQDQKMNIGSLKRKTKNAHILIIENEDIIRALLTKLLLSKKYRVVTADSGLEGLKKLKRKSFDLVIADTGITDINGEVLVKKIKKVIPELPVALIVEHEDRAEFNKIKKSAADLIISKPLDMKNVVNQVSEVLMLKVKNMLSR